MATCCREAVVSLNGGDWGYESEVIDRRPKGKMMSERGERLTKRHANAYPHRHTYWIHDPKSRLPSHAQQEICKRAKGEEERPDESARAQDTNGTDTFVQGREYDDHPESLRETCEGYEERDAEG